MQTGQPYNIWHLTILLAPIHKSYFIPTLKMGITNFLKLVAL